MNEVIADRRYVEVPLNRTKCGQLEIDARVNGRAARLVVDTGASGTVVDRESLRAWGIATAQEDKNVAVGCGGSNPASTILIEELGLEGLTLANVSVHATDFSHTNAALAAGGADRIDGVLGGDILQSRSAVIDYGKSRLHLLRAPAPPDR